jgi:transposase
MISVVDIELIKKIYHVQHISQRAIARELGLHRNTATKTLEAYVNKPLQYQLTRPKPAPVLDPHKPVIIQILEKDKSQPKKQRHTAKRIFERLRDEYGYQVSYSTIKHFVVKLREEKPEMFVT